MIKRWKLLKKLNFENIRKKITYFCRPKSGFWKIRLLTLNQNKKKMYLLFVVLMVLAAVLMCFVVLIQNSKGGGLSSSFASSNQIMGSS